MTVANPLSRKSVRPHPKRALKKKTPTPSGGGAGISLPPPTPNPAAVTTIKTAQPTTAAAGAAASKAALRGPPPPPTTGPPRIFRGPFASWPRHQRYMVTAGFAGCIIIGTLAGAVMKMDQEVKAEKQKMREATTEERTAFLEERREYLVGQKAELDKKIGGLHERMKARESGLSGR
ncbi:hypothetical protein B0T25DRAFT_64176 [Lasiosphaeria hispida]|uniref:Uncharacterized protein n=1 Tax=Lasiosphaeria hispida TaxID=260671 RepID=A0AAJ0ML49_9PEZI|nr:hypothetical protein B0T25DRAFT_64176 [Lasiosphaeria hispida]